MSKKVILSGTDGVLRYELVETNVDSADQTPTDRFRLSIFQCKEQTSDEETVLADLRLEEADRLFRFMRRAVMECDGALDLTVVTDNY